MPRINSSELDDYLEDREPRREMRKAKKKMADTSPEKKPPAVLPKHQEKFATEE